LIWELMSNRVGSRQRGRLEPQVEVELLASRLHTHDGVAHLQKWCGGLEVDVVDVGILDASLPFVGILVSPPQKR
jgi:hypothetical protein